MPCLKCGRKQEDGQAFCAPCLENMNNYPVKPGTPVQLPPSQTVQPAKQKGKKHRERKPEDEVRRLRNSVRLLSLILIVLLVAFGLVCALLLSLLEQQNLSFSL